MGYTVGWEQLPFSAYTYNNVITLVPTLIDPNTPFKVTSWGFVIGPSIDDCTAIERVPTQMTFSKTNRMPYTKDVMKALIVMVEFGAAHNLVHDDISNAAYIEALEEVHAQHPLLSYDQQKAYFISSQG